MSEDIAQVEKRVKGLWYRDGIGELAAGLALILLGLYFALGEYFGPDSWIGAILEPSLVLVLLALVALGRHIVDALKAWLVYPRTGFVEYQADEPTTPRRLFAGLAAGILAAAFAVLATQPSSLQTVPALTGLVSAGVLTFWHFKFVQVGRFLLLAAVSLALSLVLASSTLPEAYATSLYYALMGSALLASGALVLSAYLRHNPARN